MAIEIRVPQLVESVSDAVVQKWHKQPGEYVVRDELLVELETDKVVLEVPAPADGVLEEVIKPVGETVYTDDLLGNVKEGSVPESKPDKVETPAAPEAPAPRQEEAKPETPTEEADDDPPQPSPSVRKLLLEHGLQAETVEATGKGGRLLKEDVLNHLERQKTLDALTAREKSEPERAPSKPKLVGETLSGTQDRMERTVPMTRLRARIAERLLSAKQSTAMLTTFNEVNMQPLMTAREHYRDMFEKAHGVRLGFMSLFVKASSIALQRFPEVNASVDGENIVYHGYCDIGIAVSSERGLVVPMLRNAEHMSMADVEIKIVDLAERAREGKLTVEDLQGGTFTITNGGVFGSLFSTPILNPPQSAILGMHSIQKRPVVENDEIVIRPMMYLALSYDHRIIDGKSAVTFLKTIKELVEDPSRILFEV